MTDIEREVQERVKFKLNEIRDALENEANRQFAFAFETMSPKADGMREALNYLKARIAKEAELSPPWDDISDRKFREARDEAVAVIHDQTIPRGDRNEHRKLRAIVAAVEKAMRW